MISEIFISYCSVAIFHEDKTMMYNFLSDFLKVTSRLYNKHDR